METGKESGIRSISAEFNTKDEEYENSLLSVRSVLQKLRMDQSGIVQLRNFIRNNLSMPEDELSRIEEVVKRQQKVYKKGFVLRQGEICHDVFFLLSGLFRMYYVDLQGNEINCRFTFPSHFFVDFQSLLTGEPSRYYWQAMEDSEVLLLRYSEIQKIYQVHHAWERFGRIMAENVYKQVNERIEMLQFLTPEKRYEQLLTTWPELFSKVSLRQISSYLGVKPESLSRLRKRLVKGKS